MRDTPISDRLSRDGKAHYMALETARQLERMAGELAALLEESYEERHAAPVKAALAKWQAMKEGK